MMNGLSHHLDKSNFIFRGIGSDIQILLNFLMKLPYVNRIAPDGMSLSGVSHLGLCCLSMSHKKVAKLI